MVVTCWLWFDVDSKSCFEVFKKSSPVYPNSKEENWNITKVLFLHTKSDCSGWISGRSLMVKP